MIKTYIIGKRSYLSKNLKREIKNSFIISDDDFKKKCLKKKDSKEKINIIYNHAYPLAKLNKTKEYDLIVFNNINKLNRLLKNLKIKKKRVNTFIFTSSAAVYGINTNKNINKNDIRNRKIYGLTKLFSERLLLNYKTTLKFNLVIARIFNIFGENEKTSIISKIIDYKLNEKKIPIINKKKIFRDFIYIKDVVKIYKKILLKKNIDGIFDIGTGKSENVRKLINYFFKKNKQIIKKEFPLTEIEISRANNKELITKIGKISFYSTKKFIEKSLITNV